MSQRKDPNERVADLVKAAAEMFLQKGYENTSVAEIVRQVGVAQGTFYYHFKSKEAVLRAVANQFVEGLAGQVEQALNDDKLDMTGKLTQAANRAFASVRDNLGLVAALHLPSNVALHQQVMDGVERRFKALFGARMRQAAKAGEVNLKHPRETCELLFAALTHHLHDPELFENQARRRRVAAALGELMSRALGLPDGSIKIKL